MLGLGGAALLLTSGLMQHLSRIEGPYSFGMLNLILALPIATTGLATAALLGHAALEAVGRRTSYRPRRHRAQALLVLCACAALATALLTDARRPFGLSGWVGLLGSGLVVTAVAIHRPARPGPLAPGAGSADVG